MSTLAEVSFVDNRVLLDVVPLKVCNADILVKSASKPPY